VANLTANDGKSIILVFYSLDAIIAVGYMVNSLEYGPTH
jgi:hypothetical protein